MRYTYKNYKRDENAWLFKIAIIILMITIVFGILPLMHSTTYSNVTVIDKSYSGESDGYLVWVEDDNGVQYELQNEDILLKGKFNSSTIQGKLKEGEKYNIKTVGWRIPLFSSYPNIVEYEKVSD
jgi:hypothetical protein